MLLAADSFNVDDRPRSPLGLWIYISLTLSHIHKHVTLQSMGLLDNLLGNTTNNNNNNPKDKVKDKDNPKNPSKTGPVGNDNSFLPNPFAQFGKGKSSTTTTFQGQGKSLGGSKPGIVLSVELPQPGPLGIKVTHDGIEMD